MRRIIFITIALTSIIFSNINENNSTSNMEFKLIIDAPKTLDKAKLAKELGVKDNDLLNFWSSELIITKEFVDNIEAITKGYLESIGYFDSIINSKVSGDKVYLQIKLNQPIRVKEINIDSNIDIKDIVDWKKEDIFSSNRFNTIKDKINKRLLENGYCNSKLDTKAYVDLKMHSAKLQYKVEKGKLCYFGKIDIKKYPKDIKKDVIYSRLAFKERDRFDIRKIEESYNNLNALNIFANLQIKYDLDTKTRRVDTIINIDKKDKLRRYLLALGVDSEIGFRAKALWEKRNFLGDAKRVTIKTEVSKKTQDISATIFAPAMLSTNNWYFDFYTTAGLFRDKNDGYKEKKAYINSYLNYRYKWWNIKAGMELDRLIINLKKRDKRVIGGVFNLLYPYLSIEYDARDSKIDPKNGLYFKAYGEYGLSFRANGVNYFKYLLEARAIKSFNDLTLSAVGKIGAIHETNGRLPASKLFYGGGLFSNRAYGKDEIGVVNSTKEFGVLGGKSFLNLQLEANYKIHKKFYGALFFDTTMISEKEYNFKGKRIDTVGFGIRYKTPIGPVKIDVGFNIHNRKDYAISIMLGQSF